MKKGKINTIKLKVGHKDLRFSVSLVILIGMLTFSLLLLLFSLNKPTARANTQAYSMPALRNAPVLKKISSQVLDDSALNFKVTVPVQIGQWFYKIGEVKSLTDKALSDQYFQVYIPVPGVKSNNFDDQYKSIMTIRKFTKDEWSAIDSKCPATKENKDLCDAAGKPVFSGSDSKGDEATYAVTKPMDCPKNIQDKCALADKIIESFQIK